MFDIAWPALGKRAAILFAAIWVSGQEAFKGFLSKIVEIDDEGFGLDDIAKAVFYSLAVEVVLYGKNVQMMRVVKRAALIAAAIFGSQTTAYLKLKIAVAKAGTNLGPGGAAAAGVAFDALAASLAVELGQDLF